MYNESKHPLIKVTQPIIYKNNYELFLRQIIYEKESLF